MKTLRLTAVAATALALALATGCSSGESEMGSDEGAARGTTTPEVASKTLKGSFRVKLDGHNVTFNYQLEFNAGAKTVVWNAQVADKGGHPTVVDDKDVKGTMDIVPGVRCACYTATLKGSSGQPLATLEFNPNTVTKLTYEGAATTLGQPVAVASSTGEGSPDDVGACTLNGVTCAEVKRSECVAGDLFGPLTRSTKFVFVPGGSCAPDTDPPARR